MTKTTRSHQDRLPDIASAIPGEASRALAQRLSRVESRNVTFRRDPFPIFWTRAEGSNVWDVDGNRYVALTAGFGVAAVGHRHPRVEREIQEQAGSLSHGMGDVHPPAAKTGLMERLAAHAPWEETRVVLGVSGAEAVEIALKTACLATGKPGVLCFTGAYHGLTYGALSVTDRAYFRAPFEAQLNPHVVRVDFPHPYRPSRALRNAVVVPASGPGGGDLSDGSRAAIDPSAAGQAGDDLAGAAVAAVSDALDSSEGSRVGAVIVEPIQGRGGDVVPPEAFLPALAALCRDRGIMLIADEIYTGFGRTGSWLAAPAAGVVPDLVCVGKACSGGMPISACLGSAQVMDAWPESPGEAMHTTTFQGHPIACAAASAAIGAIEDEGLTGRSIDEGERWRALLGQLATRHPVIGDVRGRGLMLGLDLVLDPVTREPAPSIAERAVAEALRRGWILLLSGPEGNVISLSPPLTIEGELLDGAVEMLDGVLRSVVE
jgi:4-aminobutyrate aminotransferase/(S)-3-amino-2-methylpropionate transaminase